jgi:hypothetical protein
MFMSSQRDWDAVRGDEVEPATGGHILSDSEALKGIPVFSTAGRRLGVLDRVIVHQATGGIAFLVLVRRRLFGLLRERLVLPQSALRSSGSNGGFTVEWPPHETGPEAAAPDPPPAPPPLRLDPARGEDAAPD